MLLSLQEAGFYIEERKLSNQVVRNGNDKPETGNNFGSAAGPIAFPTDIEAKRTTDALSSVIGSISPVFFSTLEDGRYVHEESVSAVDDDDAHLMLGTFAVATDF